MREIVPVLVSVLLLPAVGWAGGTVVQNAPASVPALGESGMIALGVTLIGAGIVLLRRAKR